MLLEKCLYYLFKNFNQKFDYPVYVHYFNNIYSQKFIKNINKNISNKIFFHQIGYKIPSNISENELFYNRKEIPYVKKSFPKKRVGFLHGERFFTNITSFGKIGCLVKELEKFDYLMRIDDNSYFCKKINYDLFAVLKKFPIATAYTWNHYTDRVRDTRIELWNFYKRYIAKYKYVPKNLQLKKALINNDEMQMHKLQWTAGNCNLYNMKKFKQSSWYQYQSELNKFAGDFKYRWGDIETIGLFAYTHFGFPPYDLGLKKKSFYNNKFPSFLSSYAPGVNENFNVHNSFLLRVFHHIKIFLKKHIFNYKIADDFK